MAWRWALIIFVLTGCAASPTKIKESDYVPVHRVNWPAAFESEFNPKEDFLLLDARPVFEVTTSRLQRSQSVRVEDFPLPPPDSKEFLEELGTMARRLALKGIEPRRKVWVVGTGLNGDAEEFYFVWLLKMMGVEKVSAVSFSHIKWPVTTIQEIQPHNALPWTPKWAENVILERKGPSSPYRGFKAPADLFVWAMNKPGQELTAGQMRSFKSAKNVLWSSLYHSHLKVNSGALASEFSSFKNASVWVSGRTYAEIAAVFLALTSSGYQNVKIVPPGDVSRWL